MEEVLKKENIFWQWISWQFFDVPKQILIGWKNFLKFGLYYFSITFLLKNLFSPWRKYYWTFPRGLDIGKIIETVFSNLLSRIIGAIVRSFYIFFGILFEILVLILGFVFLSFWFFLPLILIFVFFYGIRLLFSI